MSRERAELRSWPRWVLCRTRRQAHSTAILYGIALLVVGSVAVQGLGASHIWLELALVASLFVWSLVQRRFVLQAERRLTEDVQRTIDSLPGESLDV